MLVLGLSVGLKCLIKTNELSGHVIGSLGDEAATADAKAKQASNDASKALDDSKTALSQAQDALHKTGAAEEAMKTAEDESLKARTTASNALTIASAARQEADSFKKDIASAKQLAADAEQHLADALREATQAQAELNRIRTPRSLNNEAALVTLLTPFKDTEYTLSVFGDAESIQLTREIGRALSAAGWARKQPSQIPINVPYFNVFDEKNSLISACFDTGVQIHAKAKESIEELRSRPVQSLLPKTVQAALTLQSALATNISPQDERNVGQAILDREPGEGPIMICVGKKP